MFLSTDKLKQLRNEKGWSQEVLAKATGLSVRTIQRIESDGKASAESTLSLASVYELSPQELQTTSNDIKVNWTKKMIAHNAIALLVMSSAIGMFMWLGGEISFFVDLPALLFVLLFTCAATIISFGVDGLHQSFMGLKYLFTDEIAGGIKAKKLAAIYLNQNKFVYAGAFVGLIINTISIHSNFDIPENPVMLHRAYAVNLVVLFYAALLAEGVLRPLTVKLTTCDISD